MWAVGEGFNIRWTFVIECYWRMNFVEYIHGTCDKGPLRFYTWLVSVTLSNTHGRDTDGDKVHDLSLEVDGVHQSLFLFTDSVPELWEVYDPLE